MCRLIACVTFSLVILGTSGALGQSDVLEVVKPWVTYVEAPGEKPGLLSKGSGFVLFPDGLVITAAHVVGTNQRVRVMIPTVGRREARVIRVNKSADIAVLLVPGVTGVGLRASSILASAGDDVWLFGYLVDVTQPFISMTKGIISQTYSNYYQIDAASRAGFSGGPATTRGGRVVGMLSFGLRRHESFNFIVPMNLIIEEIIAVSASLPAPPSAVTLLRLPDGSQSWEIVPGERVGPIALGASLDAVKSILGVPTAQTSESFGTVLYYERWGLAVFTDSASPFSPVETINVGIGCITRFCPSNSRALPRLYLGPQGIRLGHRSETLRDRIGMPDRETRNDSGILFWNYPDGISFGINDGIIIHISVYN